MKQTLRAKFIVTALATGLVSNNTQYLSATGRALINAAAPLALSPFIVWTLVSTGEAEQLRQQKNPDKPLTLSSVVKQAYSKVEQLRLGWRTLGKLARETARDGAMEFSKALEIGHQADHVENRSVDTDKNEAEKALLSIPVISVEPEREDRKMLVAAAQETEQHEIISTQAADTVENSPKSEEYAKIAREHAN